MFAFEDLDSCLVCGKLLKVDGCARRLPPFIPPTHTDSSTAYCSDECQSLDTASPCLSSESSALSSPHIGCEAAAGDVPPLVPSALGSALSTYRSRNRYSVSSSSASSTAWSAGEDDDEDDDTGASEYSSQDGDDVEHEHPVEHDEAGDLRRRGEHCDDGDDPRGEEDHTHDQAGWRGSRVVWWLWIEGGKTHRLVAEC